MTVNITQTEFKTLSAFLKVANPQEFAKTWVSSKAIYRNLPDGRFF